MKKILSTSLIFLLFVPAFAQAPDTLWTKRFGGSDYDYGRSVQETIDRGYILTGAIRLNQSLMGDVALIKTDSLGNAIWIKSYGDSTGFDDRGNSVKQTIDSGYIITGYYGGYGLWLLKTNSYGDTIWTKKYGNEYYDEGYSVDQTFDGGYVVSGGSYGGQIWLIKTDQYGDSIWSKKLDVGDGISVQQTADSGYIVLGSGFIDDIKLIKTNLNGDTLWTKVFDSGSTDKGHSVQETNDGGYIIVGENTDIWVIKTNLFGDTLWTKTFGEAGYDQGFSIKQTTDNGFVLTGCIEYNGTLSRDVWVIKLDSAGNHLWDITIGDPLYDQTGYEIEETSDRGFIIVAYTLGDIWLIKTTPDVSTIIPNTDLIPTKFLLSQNYPNPFNPSTKISWQSPVGSWQTLKIYDVLGNEIATLVDKYKPSGSYKIEWDASEFPSGVYFYQLLVSALQSKDGRAENYIETKKMILLK